MMSNTRLSGNVSLIRSASGRRLIQVAAYLVVLMETVSVGRPVDGQDMVFPDSTWTSSTPETQMVDPTRLMRAIEYLDRRTPAPTGAGELVVIRNGRMIWEGGNAGRSHEVYSVTKSLTSTVMGLLIDDNQIELGARVTDFLPELATRYEDMTVEHLVNQTSPYRALGEAAAPGGLSSTLWSPDEPAFLPSGAESRYSNVASEILSRILTQVSGEPIQDYFRRRIADPIGMANWRWLDWSLTPNAGPDVIAVNRGSHGLSASAKEVARLGHLFLNEGRWGDQQLISQDWVRAATSVQVDASLPTNPGNRVLSIFGDNSGPGVYGYGWWVNGTNVKGQSFLPGATTGTYLAYGIDNNVMFVVPEWDMVLVRQGSNESAVSNSVWSTFLSLVGDAVTDVPRGDPTHIPADDIRLPYAFRRVRDMDADGKGDRGDDLIAASAAIIGELDQRNANGLDRLIVMYDLPEISTFGPGIDLEHATLRFYLNVVTGTPVAPVSVFHSVIASDAVGSISDYEDSTYADTLFNFVQPTDESGRYYEIDVTSAIQSDYRTDGDNPLSAFRLQVTDAEMIEDNQGNYYEFAVTGNQINYPELILSFEASLPGDFNGDGVLDAADIDVLSEQSSMGQYQSVYDLNRDQRVDASDVSTWVTDLLGSWIGDVDLNLVFDSADLINVLASGAYETGLSSVWTTGDFNGDGHTDSGDLVAALADGGYEKGPRTGVRAVPEPCFAPAVLCGMIALTSNRKRGWKRKSSRGR